MTLFQRCVFTCAAYNKTISNKEVAAKARDVLYPTLEQFIAVLPVDAKSLTMECIYLIGKWAFNSIPFQRVLWHRIRKIFRGTTLVATIKRINGSTTNTLDRTSASNKAINNNKAKTLQDVQTCIDEGATDIYNCLARIEDEELSNVNILTALLFAEDGINISRDSIIPQILFENGEVALIVYLGKRAYNPLNPDIILDLALTTAFASTPVETFVDIVKTINVRPLFNLVNVEHTDAHRLTHFLTYARDTLPKGWANVTFPLAYAMLGTGKHMDILLKYRYSGKILYKHVKLSIQSRIEMFNRRYEKQLKEIYTRHYKTEQLLMADIVVVVENRNNRIREYFRCIRNNLKYFKKEPSSIIRLLVKQEALL